MGSGITALKGSELGGRGMGDHLCPESSNIAANINSIYLIISDRYDIT